MKRLLCIVSSLDTGGAETFMMKIFRCLPKDYKMDFIVSKDTGYYENEVYDLGGEIYRVPMRTEHPIKVYKSIREIVKENNYQYILKLCDTPIGYFDLIAAKAGGAEKICVRSCNASSSETKLRHMVNNILRPLFNHIVDVKIAPSRLAAEYTFGKEEVKKGNVNFLKNAVDIEKYKYSMEKRVKVRREFGIDNFQIVIGHIGRFNQQKNHSFLLDIFYEIKKDKEDAILLLIGDGEKKQEICEKAKKLGINDNVIFTGIRSDIPELLSAMDVFLFPSFFEGMPNTIIEAQAIGIPCVLSDSITREADVTGLLHYVSLKERPDKWGNITLKSVMDARKDTREKMIQSGYDISSSVKEFERLVF